MDKTFNSCVWCYCSDVCVISSVTPKSSKPQNMENQYREQIVCVHRRRDLHRLQIPFQYYHMKNKSEVISVCSLLRLTGASDWASLTSQLSCSHVRTHIQCFSEEGRAPREALCARRLAGRPMPTRGERKADNNLIWKFLDEEREHIYYHILVAWKVGWGWKEVEHHPKLAADPPHPHAHSHTSNSFQWHRSISPLRCFLLPGVADLSEGHESRYLRPPQPEGF